MPAVRHRLSLAICCGLVAAGTLLPACSPSNVPPPQAPAPQLWGDLKPIVSVKELMRDMIDPASDYVFDAIGTVDSKAGTVEIYPRTQADWDKLRVGGVMLAEGIYLLKIPRPFAPPGDENNSTGPDPEELSPAQIKAKLEADPVLWNAKIEALQERRPRGARHREAKRREGAMGRGREPRRGVRELSHRLLVSGRCGAPETARSPAAGTERDSRRQTPPRGRRLQVT